MLEVLRYVYCDTVKPASFELTFELVSFALRYNLDELGVMALRYLLTTQLRIDNAGAALVYLQKIEDSQKSYL